LAGWKMVPLSQPSFLLGGIAGVQVWLHPDASDEAKAAAAVLVMALKAEQFDAMLKFQNPQNPKDNMIRLNVGTKQ
jgi:hypothetical protein